MGIDYAKPPKLCYLKSEYMDQNAQGAINNDFDSVSMPPLLPNPRPDSSKCPRKRHGLLIALV
jgi:hypothetical protein